MIDTVFFLFLMLLLCRMHTILNHLIQEMPILTGNFRVLMSSVGFSEMWNAYRFQVE